MNTKGNLKITCDKCQKTFVVKATDLDFNCVEKSSREMGSENYYVAEYKIHCDCDNDITMTANVWESPTGCFNNDDYNIKGGKLSGKLDFYF